jgi:beta-galactosidase
MNALPRQRISLSRDWKFLRVEHDEMPECSAPGFADEVWDAVTLPHTPRIESASVQFPFQGLCWYRKSIPTESAWSGKRIVLEFGAGMQIADVWVNGEHRLRHLGGYLPFSIDLSDTLGAGKDALVAVRLDNRDTDLCPPGKRQAELDFSYFGGLYREAFLHITNELHVSDPLRVDIEAGGGIFVRCERACEESALVHLQAHALNESGRAMRKCRAVFEIFAPDGRMIHQQETLPVMIGAGEGHPFVATSELKNPALWHPDTPRLHKLVTRLFTNGTEVDVVETRFGVRHLAVTNRFYLNGKEFHILGANRHQEHPFIGNAVPPNAHRRDARRLKDAGFNFVRLSHYPQDPSFLDACDELGLLVQAAIPGWQQFWMNDSFIRQSFRDVRELIRRDRNHPSIVFWEPNLNETGVGEDGEGHADWCRTAHEITHREYPGDQCFTFGDDYPVKTGWNWDVQGLWREYGDFAYGGNESTSRQTRADGDKGMLQQAWNFLWTYNHLTARFAQPDSVYLGCAVWVMFDYNRGYYHKPCTSGMTDIFRLPKYVHYLYQSQRDPRFVRDDVAGGPLVFLATDWTPRQGTTKVVVFSNCDEIELRVNGRVIARRKPDAGPDTPYSVGETSLATTAPPDGYDPTGGNPFDGGNAANIPHPPFTFFDVPYACGRVEAIGYLDGPAVATHQVSTPGNPHQIEIVADLAGIPLAENQFDIAILHARILDENGTLLPISDIDISFEVDGGAELIGPCPATTQTGIASILLRSQSFERSIHVQARGQWQGIEFCGKTSLSL